MSAMVLISKEHNDNIHFILVTFRDAVKKKLIIFLVYMYVTTNASCFPEIIEFVNLPWGWRTRRP